MPTLSALRRADITRPSTETLLDLGCIAGIGLLVAAVHVLVPPALQHRLALQYHDVEVHSLFTSAFVHHSDRHLLSNLFGYVVAAGLAYGLARLAGRRRWFSRTLLALVLVGPVVVSVCSLLTLTGLVPGVSGNSRGFSGIVGGCVGMGFVALLCWIQDRHGWATAGWVGFGIYLVLMVELSVIYSGGVALEVGVFAGGGLVVTGWQLWSGLGGVRIDLVVEGIFTGLVVVLLGLFVFVLFPSQLSVGGGATINIVAHGVGVVFGVVVSGGAAIIGNRR
ncbi:hypothetical protein NDI56_20190 [Haloarcula sp. S1CR25-12]|uniref:Rhomboid family intramembrane serine protease n=1 Tax=Haloarcula saliterrae TaxID=2950534 RepID=A0ABU2FHK8_9EURY|nr:hypothetical protein [Haloarcula sp. S1CR25-12]MDS0261727.1 hypothetical protein [Haloarcula sp. S1CR25-12]